MNDPANDDRFDHLPTPPRPVVVGVDGSEDSLRALMWAAGEARARRTPVRIVHAWTVPTVALTNPVVPSTFIEPSVFEGEGMQIVHDAANAVRHGFGGGCPVIEVRVVAGPPVSTLIDAARDGCLLVVGTRGRGAIERTLMGSVAEGCLGVAPVPVVVVGEATPAPGAGPVVVGVDASPAAREALRWAAREAGRSGRRLVVVHAQDLESTLRYDRESLPGGIDAVMEHGARRFLDQLLTEVAVISGRPRSTAWRVVAGRPADVLSAASAGASMLVLGQPHPHGLAERLLGSTARRCVRAARCPVAVVPVVVDTVRELECAS